MKLGTWNQFASGNSFGTIPSRQWFLWLSRGVSVNTKSGFEGLIVSEGGGFRARKFVMKGADFQPSCFITFLRRRRLCEQICVAAPEKSWQSYYIQRGNNCELVVP